jgi:hypothetical protein
MLIGLNPGGAFEEGKEPFNPHETIKIPLKHDYEIAERALAKAMRNLFDFNIETLFNSVKLNCYFFRSPSVTKLYRQPEFCEINKFCSVKQKEIIHVLKPKNILCEGITVFDMLCNLLKMDIIKEPIYDRMYRRYRIFQITFNQDFKLIGIIHPTGKYTRKIFNANSEIIQQQLRTSLCQLL